MKFHFFLGILSLALTTPSFGATIIFDFRGTITTISEVSGIFDGAVSSGSPFRTSLRFDIESTEDRDPYSSNGNYWAFAPNSSFSLSVDSLPFYNYSSQHVMTLQTRTNSNDYLFAVAYFSLDGTYTNVNDSFLSITLSTPNVSRDFPTSLPPISAFGDKELLFIFDTRDGNKLSFSGNIDSLSVSVVPEPTTILYIILASLALLFSWSRPKGPTRRCSQPLAAAHPPFHHDRPAADRNQ